MERRVIRTEDLTFLLAIERATKEKPQGGLVGFEQEWNLFGENYWVIP